MKKTEQTSLLSDEAERCMLDSMKETLKAMDLFWSLDEDGIDEIIKIAQTIQVPEGNSVFEQGDAAEEFFIILSGSIIIIRNRNTASPEELAVLTQGDFFGEMGPLQNQPRSASAVAGEASDLMTLQRRDFLTFLARHKSFGMWIQAIMARRQSANIRLPRRS